MRDSGFVPFAPRRLQRTGEPTSAAIGHTAADCFDAQPREPEIEQAPVCERSERVESSTGDLDASLDVRESTVAQYCEDTHAAAIRATAIQLAATACARALHYALDKNPRLLARFVDDALRAAGQPHNAVVRVAPSVTAVGAASTEHDFVADSSLAPGDVFIDCAAGTLGATLEERAELLVRAAAS